jgi:hypothetical protein
MPKPVVPTRTVKDLDKTVSDKPKHIERPALPDTNKVRRPERGRPRQYPDPGTVFPDQEWG